MPAIRMTKWRFRLATLAVSLFAGTLLGEAAEPRGVIISSDLARLHTLRQNWDDADARWFYSVPQGSKLIPYAWFLHLEIPGEERLFQSESHIRSLGYLPRNPGSQNPDGLPIGFTKDGDHLGLTCAACHTNQINFEGEAWLVDGAPTLGDFETFLRRLTDAVDQTLNDAEKFDRFASRLLPDGGNPAERNALKGEFRRVLAARRGYNNRNLPREGAPHFGPGRVDAFGAIMNEITATFAQLPVNHSPANAPVSYPFLWDAPRHDRVQWNGAAENNELALAKPLIGTAHVGALGRNAGEVLGVFGRVDASEEGSIFQLRGYPSSVNRPNLIDIEERLTDLQSPRWPAEFPPIDEALRAQGQALFRQHCQSCHHQIDPDDPGRVVHADMSAVGTDPMMAANFASRTARTGILEGRSVSLLGVREMRGRESYETFITHMVQRVILRRPLGPELSDVAGTRLMPVLFDDSASANGEAETSPEETPMGAALAEPELTREQAEAALEVLSQWNPDYRVFADITVGDTTLSGGFKGLEFAEGRLRQAVGPDDLRLRKDKQAYRLDATSLEAEPQFVAPDGSHVSLESIPGVRHELAPAGTRLTFAEAATASFAYKGRPLNGIWATAPYLHNGSVPNLDELLKPADERPERFRVGSREFDPVKVGFVNEGDFEFDTTLPGNSNAGHAYGDVVFTEEQRRALVEYMKSL